MTGEHCPLVHAELDAERGGMDVATPHPDQPPIQKLLVHRVVIFNRPLFGTEQVLLQRGL